ncbi:MAG: hypothetical protein IKJ35_02910 [Clostridia bacterium]|nr:hypothetical protein [Clostridia bacterium]
MYTFEGIPISDLKVLVHNLIFSIMFLVLAVVFGFWLYTSLTMENPKKKQRIKALKEKAKHDEAARKQLDKIERQNKRRRKRNRGNMIFDIFILVLSICCAGLLLFFGIVPGWIDYVKKDYVVYTGEITFHYKLRSGSYIELADGTTVWGGKGAFDSEDTYGTVVYSKRTKLFLDGNEDT